MDIRIYEHMEWLKAMTEQIQDDPHKLLWMDLKDVARYAEGMDQLLIEHEELHNASTC